MGRHQIQVTRVRGVKLHHVVHRLPYANVTTFRLTTCMLSFQVDLGRCGGCPSGDGAPGGASQVGRHPGGPGAMCGGAGCPKQESQPQALPGLAVAVPTLCPLLSPLPQEPPTPCPHQHVLPWYAQGRGFTVKKTFWGGCGHAREWGPGA